MVHKDDSLAIATRRQLVFQPIHSRAAQRAGLRTRFLTIEAEEGISLYLDAILYNFRHISTGRRQVLPQQEPIIVVSSEREDRHLQCGQHVTKPCIIGARAVVYEVP